jgi:hypothetical protein
MRLLSIVAGFLLGLPAFATQAAETSPLLVVSTSGLSPAEQVLLSGIQGLLNRTNAVVWLQSGGVNARILEQLREEGRVLEPVAGPWPLVQRFRDQVDGLVLGSVADESINRATSIAAVTRAFLVDASLASRPEWSGLPVIADARTLSEEDLWTRFGPRFTRGLAVHQPARKTLHLRDLAVSLGLRTFYDVPKAERIRRIRELGPGTRVFGWGEDEHEFVGEVSDAGGAVLPADWSLNLSALHHLPPSGSRPWPPPLKPGPAPRNSVPVVSPSPRPRPAPLTPGERVVAFVITDGDNLQWVGGGFVEAPGFWASTNRGRFPVTWEMAPSLAEFAPRVLDYIRSTATPLDDFVCGPSGYGYQFPSRLPDRLDAASRTGRAAEQSGFPWVTLLDSGGAPDRVPEWLSRPEIRGVLYKDYAPYNGHRGAVAWHAGKPAVSYRFLLWESKRRDGTLRPDWLPDGVAAAIGALPVGTAEPSDRFALVNVHAWSFRDSGGPMGAIRRTVDQLAGQARVVTACDFFELLQQTRR